MPIMLTRKDGPPTPFRNAEYIPFYYFIPKSILSRCGAELNAIPRNPQELFHNRAACEFVESDLFRLLIIDATAFMVWPYMGFGEYMEIYSGYDPAWRFAHCPDYWIQELTDEGILASAGELFKGCHSALGYVPEWQIDIYLRYIVPNVMKKHRMDEIIQAAREYPCFEDFDFRKSNQKTDFIRKWYSVELSQKIHRGMAINAEKCLSNGSNPGLGFKVDAERRFYVDEEEAAIVREIYERYASGETKAEIIRDLKRRRVKTSLGKEFSPNSLSHLLSNKRYIGVYLYKGKETPGGMPRILDDDLFYRVQSMMNKNKNAPARTHGEGEYC